MTLLHAYLVSGLIIKRKSGEVPCPLAVEAFAAHLSYICKYDDKFSKYASPFRKIRSLRVGYYILRSSRRLTLGCVCPCRAARYFIFHKPNKTWQQVFWLSISIAINNAYVLYKMSDAYAAKRYSRAQFGERLVKELLDVDDDSPTA